MTGHEVNPAFGERMKKRQGERRPDGSTERHEHLPCVLVVDDDPGITGAVTALLDDEYDVLAAHSADEALEILTSRPVTVVLTDQRMPGGTGAELLARALDISPETTRVLFTGYSDVSAFIEAINRGQVYYYMTKPWLPEDLKRVVRHGFERHRLAVEKRKLLEELTVANRDLAAANLELEEYAYTMTHDLRTPLRALDGFSHAVLEDYGDLLDDTGRDYLRRIRAASQHMGELFDAQLRLSRSGRIHVESVDVDVSELAGRVAGSLGAERPDLDVRIAVQPGMHAHTDATVAWLVLERLLDNAWKFTSKKEVAHVDVGCEVRDGEQVFFVRDDGEGFDPAYAGRLFAPFERLHEQEEFNGLGIGLASVRRMLGLLGGRCWAEGEVGRGAVLWFTLGEDRVV